MRRRCFEFYKETRESWLPFDFNEYNNATQIIPPSPVANPELESTAKDISVEEEDEALLKLAEPL